jgi:hypothetical protein
MSKLALSVISYMRQPPIPVAETVDFLAEAAISQIGKVQKAK